MPLQNDIRTAGSSPRMRGTQLAYPCAGVHGAVHPHACGEHDLFGQLDDAFGGSSPRMRGTLVQWDVPLDIVRFIPTHAGNTTKIGIEFGKIPVHPHACGEHILPTYLRTFLGGSSPRMRGTPPMDRAILAIWRFIPTHAGNTFLLIIRPAFTAVHPHACGEHDLRLVGTHDHSGSSPRMRGTRHEEPCKHQRVRFIPTHAGNTRREAIIMTGKAVHPHACGEHVLCLTLSGISGGSSPRMRGTRMVTYIYSGNGRFIPTHAGNTIQTLTFQQDTTVHPHACGEHPGLGAA